MNNTNTSRGIGFCGLLAIVFIAFKLLGIIQWGWLWVLSPLWIPALLLILFIVFILKLGRR